MGLVAVIIPITTDGSGNADVVSDDSIQGEAVAVHVDVVDTDAGADFTITERDTGAVILQKSNVASDVKYPTRTPLYDTSGAPIVGAYGAIPVIGPIRVQVAQGGAAKTATVTIDVDGTLIP